jgi:membrane associated rhomboid family serine protease
MVILLGSFTGVFLLQVLIKPFGDFALEYLALDTSECVAGLRVWQFITAIFLHGSIQHFVVNMVFLWFLGSALANAWRAREFITFFLVSGLSGSISFYVFGFFCEAPVVGLGASGAIFGLMAAYAMVYGDRTILAFFMIPMKAKWFIAILLALELLVLWTGTPDGVAHIAHLGGAAAGFLYLKVVWKTQDVLAGGGDKPANAKSRMSGLEVMSRDDRV